MKNFILFSFILLFSFQSRSQQHRADKWLFGLFAGVDFLPSVPEAITGATATNEGTAAISDAAGNLLFYTDGVTVWNQDHQPMPNGTGLFGGISATQSAIIVPQPGTTDIYYIFTVPEIGGPEGFCYSIVDMTLQSGLGDVTTKNELILPNVTEKLAAGIHANGSDYWIAVHEWNTDAFYLYTLTSAGFQTTPVISNAGTVHTNDAIQNTYGQMKFSMCEEKIGVAIGYMDIIEILDFNPVTGEVSNPITLPMTDHVYGLEFSPDENFLYVTTYEPYETLLQFDITSGNATDILASKSVISGEPSTYALQMGPDHKIYVCKAWSTYLGVIEDPSEAGVNCNYVTNGLNLDPNGLGVSAALGLPNFVQSFFEGKTGCVATAVDDPAIAEDGTLYPNPSSDLFYLQRGDLNEPCTIKILDETGRTVKEIVEGKHSLVSFGSDLSAGVYTVLIQTPFEVSVKKALKIEN